MILALLLATIAQSVEVQVTRAGFFDRKTQTTLPGPASALVEAALAKPVVPLDPARLPVDAATLLAAAEAEARARRLPPEAARHFISCATDPAQLPALARSLYGGYWSDDEVAVKVELQLDDGRKVLLSSEAQAPLMLPWTVERDGARALTFDPAVPAALAALLPQSFLERERIAGERLAALLVRQVERDPFQTEAAEELVGAELAELKRRFTIRRAVVASLLGLQLDGERVWNSVLEAPDRSTFDLTLSMHGKRVHSPATFLREADELARRVRALPDLAGHRVVISFVDDHPLSAKGRRKARALHLPGDGSVLFWKDSDPFLLSPDGRVAAVPR